MTTREVKYTVSGPKLTCEECLPAKVILAVPPSLVPDGYDDLEGYLFAEITAVSATPGGVRIYTFEYDELLLASVDVPLLSSDILGFFCVGVKENWMIDMVRRAAEA